MLSRAAAEGRRWAAVACQAVKHLYSAHKVSNLMSEGGIGNGKSHLYFIGARSDTHFSDECLLPHPLVEVAGISRRATRS